MSLNTRPCDLLVTDDSHMSDAVSSRALSTSRHFWPRAQMGLRSGVRAHFDTVSSTESSLTQRGKSRNLIQHGQRPPHTERRSCRILRRMCLWTLSVCSDSCAVKTGTSARLVRWCPSLRRWKRSKRASVRGTGVRLREWASRAAKKSFYWTPYQN